MKIAVFAYDFPHSKTERILWELYLNHITVDCVIAAPWENLNQPISAVRVKLYRQAMHHPRDICARLGIPYFVCAHNSDACVGILRNGKIDIGIIAGARILKPVVIDAVGTGIINLHPGLIPEASGLDALKWSIYKDIDLGVTAHFIDKRVDGGYIILQQTISLHCDDTFFDLSERLETTELIVLMEALHSIEGRVPADFSGGRRQRIS